MKEIKVMAYIDGFHIPIGNRSKNPLAVALSGVGGALRGSMGAM
jgi:hypothetical protein